MLDKKLALRSERYKNNRIFFFECSICKSELRVQQQYIPKHSGLCVKCAQYDVPFKACYGSLKKAAKSRGYKVELTFDEFLQFTTINNCHYCNDGIKWYPHTSKDKEISRHTRSYKLDRKDNSVGYTKGNCVVCCWKCNQGKGDLYTYEEWYAMTEYFRKHLTFP